MRRAENGGREKMEGERRRAEDGGREEEREHV